MPTSRCVYLMLVGIASGAKEMWIANQPFLLFHYAWQYAPTFAWFITNILSKKRVENFKAGLVGLQHPTTNLCVHFKLNSQLSLAGEIILLLLLQKQLLGVTKCVGLFLAALNCTHFKTRWKAVHSQPVNKCLNMKCQRVVSVCLVLMLPPVWLTLLN